MAQYIKNDVNFHGARSKTTGKNSRRQRQDSDTKKNRNESSVNSNNNSSWNVPLTYASGIWGDEPTDSPPIKNAWEQDREVSGWSRRNQKFQTAPNHSSIRVNRENPDWNDVNSEFPPLESKPPVNVWEVREQKFLAKKAMEPSNESEEERMIRQALELSKIEAVKDEKKRRELEEEYKMQMHLMQTNPLLFEEFRTDEEIASSLIAMGRDVPIEKDFDYDKYPENNYSYKKVSHEQNVYNHEENYPRASNKERLQNGEKLDLALPTKKSVNASRKPNSGGENKAKISKVVEMFGGWGQTQKNSQKAVRVDSPIEGPGATNPHPKLPFENNSGKNQTTAPKKNIDQLEVPEDVEENSKKNKVSTIEDKFECRQKNKDNGSFQNKKIFNSNTKCTRKSDRDESAGAENDEDWAWKSDIDESASNVKKDKDWGWKSDIDESASNVKKDKDWGWKSDIDESASNVKKDKDWGWKSDIDESASNVKKDKEQVRKSDRNKSTSGAKCQDEDRAWKSKNTISSIKPENICETKTEEKNFLVEEKNASKSVKSAELARNIVSDYVDLAAKCESTSSKYDQNKKDLACEKKPSGENIFRMLQKDYREGISQSQNSQTDSFNSAKRAHLLPNESVAVNNFNKLQFTDLETANTKNEISYSLKSTPQDVSGLSFSNENGWNKLQDSQTSNLHKQSLDCIVDDDISLPLFPPSQSNTNDHLGSGNAPTAINPPQLPVLGPFPESLRAHFQQFQLQPNPMTPAFMNSNFVHPNLMMGMNAMNTLVMQQQMAYPILPEMMQGYYKSMGLPMGVGVPYFPQSVLGVPNFQPFMNLACGPFGNAQSQIDPPIPPPNQRSGFELNNGTSLESDKWLEHFLPPDPQSNEPLILPPTVPQNSASNISSLAAPVPLVTTNFPADAHNTANSAQRDDSRWLDDGDVAGSNDSNSGNDDWETGSSKSMRNSSRYIAERNQECRQPARQPCFGRGSRKS